MASAEHIHVTLTSPESTVWEGEATSVTSTNSDGLFDLYPDHARFMTLLENVDLIVRQPDDTEQVFSVEKAVLLFQEGEVKVYLHTHIDPQAK